MAKDTLYLIDGTAILYRAYFAFIKNPLINSKGQHTSALFGTINSFLRLLDVSEGKYFAIGFDRKEPTFRVEISSDYKANRPPMPNELVSQLEPIRQFFSLLGMDEYSLPGYEADDVLCTMADRYKDKFNVVLVTGDKDYAQVVSENVGIFDPKKEQFLNPEKVYEKYGVRPDQFVDYLALMGDSADNIPGVKGIGPKTASALLQEYDTLEGIYEHVDEIKGSKQKKLIEFKEDAFTSRKLAKIVLDVPIETDEKEFLFAPTDFQKVSDFLDFYEIASLKKKLATVFGEKLEDFVKEDQIKEESEVEFKPILVNTEKSFLEMIDKMVKHEFIAFDTETTGIDAHDCDLVGVAIAFEDGQGCYIPFRHLEADNLDIDKYLPKLVKALKNKILIGHNIKYDLHVLHYEGYDLRNKLFDTMVAAYLLDAGRGGYSLDKCAEIELDYEMMPISELIGKGKNQLTFDRVPLQTACKYSAEDAYVTYLLHKMYCERLENNNLDKLFFEMEMPLISTLLVMEQNGVFCDTDFLSGLEERIEKLREELENNIYEIAGYELNLNSTKQLGKLLFEDMGIPPVKKTKTGYSTDTTVLEKLAHEHEIARHISDYRQLTKLLSTYVTALPKLINSKSGRIHSSFNQTIASTGRLSSTNPNLQNIPIRTEMGREIRKAFHAEEASNMIISADYSQIELRLLAILSKDKEMIKAFSEGIDIHTRTAALIFDIPEEQVSKEQRSQAKTINFGIIYGMGSVKLSQTLNISRKEAKQFIENYFKTFPTIKNWMDEQVKFAKQNEYCETMLGRRLYLPNINKENRFASDSERVAVNMPIQGSAADIIKVAMNNVQQRLKDDEYIKMIIQVHDELIFEVDTFEIDRAKKLIKEEMEKALPDEYKGIIPLTVDIGEGDNWYEAH